MTEKATIANGCFWCTEAIFKQLKGVLSVKPGYTGGHRNNPTYEQVSTGVSGHAEAIQVEFDPQIISYKTILDVFWHTHNPTTLNQQGADHGTQYRSAVFFHTQAQKELAEDMKKAIEKEGVYPDPVVTEIVPFTEFFPAENYHHDYFEKNKTAPYCEFVIKPKLQKFRDRYSLLI